MKKKKGTTKNTSKTSNKTIKKLKAEVKNDLKETPKITLNEVATVSVIKDLEKKGLEVSKDVKDKLKAGEYKDKELKSVVVTVKEPEYIPPTLAELTKTFTVVYKKPSEIKHTNFNPASRTEGKKIEKLIKSIKTKGLYLPIIVNDKFEIVDGNRRFYSMKKLKWELIPCQVKTGELTSLFKDINFEREPINSVQGVEIYLKGGESAVSDSVRNKINILTKLYNGTAILERMLKLQKNPVNIARIVQMLNSYLSETTVHNDETFQKKIVEYCLVKDVRKLKEHYTSVTDTTLIKKIQNKDEFKVAIK